MTNESHSRSDDLKALGESAAANKPLYKFDEPDYQVLERFRTPVADEESREGIEITIDCPEFTCLCPKTGQPDFGHLVIRYVPGQYCVESKSLKLYLMGYRNHGTFHEQVTRSICQDLATLIDPVWLQVEGDFGARGGIAIKPVATYRRK